MGKGTKKTHFLISSKHFQKQVSYTVKVPLKRDGGLHSVGENVDG